MNISETAELLKEISAIDNRKIDEATIQGWFAILNHIPLEIAKQAHKMARRDQSVSYLEPKHIVGWAREAAYALDRQKSKVEDEVKRGDPEPICKAHSKKITQCMTCCKRMAHLSEETPARILLWAKENIYA